MKKKLINFLGLTGIIALISYTAAVVFSAVGFNAVLGTYLFNSFKG